MTDDDELLKRLGALAKAQAEEPPRGAAPLDDLARARIVAHVAERVAPARSSPLRRIGSVAGGLALAAALLVVVTRLSGPAPLPEYALRSTGAATIRGPAAAPVNGCIVQSNDRGEFELVASTERPVAPPVVARAFLVKGDDLVPWPDVETSPHGSVRVTGAQSALAGASELRVVVARSESDALAGARGETKLARVLRCAIE
ncbi:MAG: hypothetical protein KF819_04160 [Labilithrix sp.]|nr:hypothetical protein [Labilithrix sp.]